MPQGKKKDIAEQRFGRLVAIKDVGRKSQKSRHIRWECKCDCGKVIIIDGDKLRSGHTQSCGCYNRDIISRFIGENNPMYGTHMSDKAKKHLSDLLKGRKVSAITKAKMSKAGKGKIFTAEHRRKISESRMGKDNPNWNGGITPEDCKLRKSLKATQWRSIIYKRDNYLCQECKEAGLRLNAHHIKSWKDYPDLRFDVDNGITLCIVCHRKKHKKKELYIGTDMQLSGMRICEAII